MVRTSWPSAITASVVQDLTALPSRCTTQAPHCEVSQPTWVPVSRRFSRSNWTRRVRGSILAFTGLPFTIREILAISTLLSCTAAYRLRRRLNSFQGHIMGHPGNEQPWQSPAWDMARYDFVWRSWQGPEVGAPEDQPCTALAKLAKNSSASFLAVPLIRRCPSWASLPPICASTLSLSRVPPSFSAK